MLLIRLIPLICLFSAQAFAWPIYTVGVEDIDYMPIFSSTHNPENFKGYAREILNNFAKSEKIEFKYISLPVKRFINVSQSGKVDFSFPDNPNWELPEKKGKVIFYSDPLITFQDAVYVLPERSGQGVVKMKTLGTLKGFSAWKFQKYIDAGLMTTESAHSPESLIQMALLGRVDGINMAKQVVEYHLNKIKRPKALIADQDLMPSQESFYSFSTIKHPELIKKLNIFLKKDAANIAKLKKQYGL